MVWSNFLFSGMAAIAAGFVNAVAGGGTLITFPVLTAIGVPAIAANVTNTVALCPGYLGATFAQKGELIDQKMRLMWLIPISVIGGIAGGFLLLKTEERMFRELVPWLILLASFLLAIQNPVRKWIQSRNKHNSKNRFELLTILLIIPAAIYGGYFGAGVSVIVLATLGLFLDDSLIKLNALKQIVAFCINIAAAIFFLFSGQVQWLFVLVMACGSLFGGVLGGKLANSIKPVVLRWIVVSIGVIVASVYLWR